MAPSAPTSEQHIQELISEVFGFAPSSFTRTAEDLANHVIYNVMAAIETELFKQFGETTEVKKALVSLETLLEANVDKSFDRFEAFCFRNIFTLKEELLPYIRLEHQPEEGYDESLRGQDTALLSEWVKERDATDEALVQAAAVRAAQARVDRRLAALEKLKAELDALTDGKEAEELQRTFGSLTTEAERFSQDSAALLAQPTLIEKAPEATGPEPWQSREGYLQWAARKGVAAHGQGTAKLEADIRAQGSEQDARSLLNLLSASASS